MKTCGVISDDPVTGVTEIADPLGVICGITPVTNPTSTVIFKCLISLKTRNPIIFAFHPNAQKCSSETAKLIVEAAVKAGAPKNCIQWIEHPSMDATNALMQHKDIASILATGGNAMVKAAYSCGKPALGVGAGNVGCAEDRRRARAGSREDRAAGQAAGVQDHGLRQVPFRSAQARKRSPQESKNGGTQRGAPLRYHRPPRS